MLDRRRVGAAQPQRRLDRRPQTCSAEPSAKLQQLDHRPGPVLTPMALHQPAPELVVADWPATSSPPLLQRLAAGEGARLMLEHVQIVFKVEHVLIPTVAAGVTCDAAAFVPDLDRRRGEFDLRFRAWRQRRRIGVGSRLDAAQPIDLAEAHLHQIKALAGQWQQMLALDRQRLTHRLRATIDTACLVLMAASQQHGVQLLQVARRGHGHQMVATEGPDFAFYATLFMALAWRTEARLKIPVRTERDEARRLLTTEAAQDLLHRRAKVVVAQTAEGTPQ